MLEMKEIFATFASSKESNIIFAT